MCTLVPDRFTDTPPSPAMSQSQPELHSVCDLATAHPIQPQPPFIKRPSVPVTEIRGRTQSDGPADLSL
ncbi:hypothetical protein FA13DRAFT_1734389 [Coprinellus micaceus]|uniref:Uncharacterized protein n=1 Tax=Coprinellus micaceus TaxID=71717 RepID=A0A4Y7T6M2_COPMI|nr:hypothetical protein FA13DRAFT_1734389 [Coprinellus micaceus]